MTAGHLQKMAAAAARVLLEVEEGLRNLVVAEELEVQEVVVEVIEIYRVVRLSGRSRRHLDSWNDPSVDGL